MSADETMMMTEDAMAKAVEHLTRGFRLVRTGRATPTLVENLRVNVYGSDMTIKQLGTISVPEARQLVIKPFDPGTIKDIEKSILASDLGVNPQNDGKVLRIALPPLTEDRRKKLAGEIKSKGEDTKITIRNSRRDGIKELEALQKAKTITEDDVKTLKEDIQDLVKKFEAQITIEVDKKTKEVMEI